jgi:hypothetical protein
MTDEQKGNQEEAAGGMDCADMMSQMMGGDGCGCGCGNMEQMMGEQERARMAEMMSQMMSGQGQGCNCGCGNMEEMMSERGQGAFMEMMSEMMRDGAKGCPGGMMERMMTMFAGMQPAPEGPDKA